MACLDLTSGGRRPAGVLAEQLRRLPPGTTLLLLAAGLSVNPLRVTLFSVSDETLIASTQVPVDGAPAGSRIVLNLNQVTAAITT